MKDMKKSLKALIVILLTPILLFFILSLLLYCRPVQQWAVDKATAYASEKTGMKISIGRVDLSFPLYLKLDSVLALQPRGGGEAMMDTVVNAQEVVVDVQLLPLFKRRVEVDALTLKQLKTNTLSFIGDLRIKGELAQLHIVSHGIDLHDDSIHIDRAMFNGGWVDIALADTVPEDTTTPKPLWRIGIDKTELADVALALHLPGDTISIDSHFEKAVAQDAHLFLKDNIYSVGKFDCSGSRLAYDANFQPRAKQGFDAGHIACKALNLGIDSLHFAAPALRMRVRAANFKEHSGLMVKDFQSAISLNATLLNLSDLHLKMSHTDLSGQVNMPLNAFANRNPGEVALDLKGNFHPADFNAFLPVASKKYVTALPTLPISLDLRLKGNLQRARIAKMRLEMQRYFSFSIDGSIENPTDLQRLSAKLALQAAINDLRFAQRFLPHELSAQVKLPQAIGLKGYIGARNGHYKTNIRLTTGGGGFMLVGEYDRRTDAYAITAKVHQFPLQRFLPRMKCSPLTAQFTAKGRGIDLLKSTAQLNLNADIGSFQYENYLLNRLQAKIRLRNAVAQASVQTNNAMITSRLNFSGKVVRRKINGRLWGKVTQANLRQLGIKDYPYLLGTEIDLLLTSDLAHTHTVKGTMGNLLLHSEHRGQPQQLLAAGDFWVDGTLKNQLLTANFDFDLRHSALKSLGLTPKDYHAIADGQLHIRTDMKHQHSAEGSLNHIQLTESHGNSEKQLFTGGCQFSTNMNGKAIKAQLKGNVGQINLYDLGFTQQPFTASFAPDLMFTTDGREAIFLRGTMGQLKATIDNKTYCPSDVFVDLLSQKDTLKAIVKGGDFTLNTAFSESYQQLLANARQLYKELKAQAHNKFIDQPALRQFLPTGHFTLKSGKTNFFSSLLAQQGYSFQTADIALTSSPIEGLNGSLYVERIQYDSLCIDTLRGSLYNEQENLHYNLTIANDRTNTYPYIGRMQGAIYEHGLQSSISVDDLKGRSAIDLGFKATVINRGLNLSLTSSTATLGYKQFTVNDDNFVYVGRDRHVSANLQMKASDGAGLQLVSEDSDSTSLQNLTLSVHRFEVEQLLAILPFAPRISGELNGDYHIVQTSSDLTISTDMAISNMTYEQNPMGKMGLQLVYMPLENGTHKVAAYISKDDEDVGELSGTYNSAGAGHLEAEFAMKRFPLNYINGFVPDKIVGLQGVCEGMLTLNGALNKLDIDGELQLESAHLESIPYGVNMRFADDPVLINNSRVEFENFELFANNNSPLTMRGYLDFSNLDKMRMDIQMRAQNFQIINAKENPRSEVFGKVFVDFNGRMQGLLSKLDLRGRLDVLGNTDMTYILRDATLTTDNELNDLVQFAMLNDSTPDVVRRPDITGFTMGLSVNIDEQAHILCALNSDKSNYIDLFGGGTLLMNYAPATGVELRGRYTLGNGVMKYSLPVIPLRTFNIQQGSYIEFQGNPMEPLLSIEATEEVRASVADVSGQSRFVDFQCGVRLSKRFPKPGIEFIIDAPEDQEIKNELNTRSAEERSKLAVTMLASGLYLDGTNTSGTNTVMSGALAGFLQSQVNAITGTALKSMGLSLSANMESTADANGALHTDYTFKFSKRLWDNRLRLVMGGRVSTGSQLSERNGAFFDNLSMEYRLNKKETKYLKVFYEREAYDWLEGQQGEFGVGFMWRRKLQHFKDIFKFKSQNTNDAPLLDSVKTKKDSLIRFENEQKK